jgi:CheY-like chemotaxis protein
MAPRDALLAQRRVLVIEDDADSRAALIGLLCAWGCEVRSAEDVTSARQRLADGFHPEAVLADLRLAGGASGIDAVIAVVSACRQAWPTDRPPPLRSSGAARSSVSLEFIQDRAVGPMVALAAMDQVLQSPAHGCHVRHPLIQLRDVLRSDPAHVRA